MTEEITRKEWLQSEKVDLEKQLDLIADAKVKNLESSEIARKRTEKGLAMVQELIDRE